MSQNDELDLAGLRQELEETRAELQRSLAEQHRLRDLVEKSPDKLRAEEAQALLLAAETARDAAQQKVRDVSRLLSESVQKNHNLQKQLRSSNEETSAELQGLEKERALRAELDLKLKDTLSDLEDHQLALSTSEEQVNWLEGEVEEREETIDSLTKQTASYLSKLRVAQEKLLTLGQAVTERNQLIRLLQEQRQNLGAKCRTWEALHDRLKERGQELEAELAKNKDEAEQLRWELGETLANLEDSALLCSSLQDQVMTQMPASRAQIIQLQSQLRVAEAEIARLRARYETIVDAPVPSPAASLTGGSPHDADDSDLSRLPQMRSSSQT